MQHLRFVFQHSITYHGLLFVQSGASINVLFYLLLFHFEIKTIVPGSLVTSMFEFPNVVGLIGMQTGRAVAFGKNKPGNLEKLPKM